MKIFLPIIFLILPLLIPYQIKAQYYNVKKGCLSASPNGDCLPNPLTTATPFLRINPSAREGGMGDVGIALSSDANSMHFNASKIAFSKNDMGLSATYTPWLRQLGLQDVYIAYFSAYKKINEISFIGFSHRFFSLGEIQFTGPLGSPIGSSKPREFETSIAYGRKLAKNLSIALTAKYIYSNLAAGQRIASGIEVSAGQAFASDLSLYYKIPLNISERNSNLSFGLSISNLGSRITYTNDLTKDYLPANLGIGAAWKIEIDDFNSITIATDINKLLVPTPQIRDSINIHTPSQRSAVAAAIRSFNDASGGSIEELSELYFSTGIEYWYKNQFALRSGYFYESERKGGRQFLTLGMGIKYKAFGTNLSYLITTNDRKGPLDNTLRFSVLFDFGKDNK